MSTWELLSKRQAPDMPMPTPEELAFNVAPRILTITGTFFAIAAMVVLLRCYVRIKMLKVFGGDDYVMLLAMIILSATFACFKLRCDNGIGRHLIVALMQPVKFARISKIVFVQALLFMVGVSVVKISIGLQLLRLSTQKLYARIVYGVLGFIILMTIACAGTLVFQCSPIEAAWETSLQPPPVGTGTAKCYSIEIYTSLGLMNSSFNIITDITFALLPVPLIWKLQLNIRTKLSLIATLSLGWFACTAAIIKAVKQSTVLTEPDFTANDSFFIWAFIEFSVGIIAGSLPSLKPIFNWFFEVTQSLSSRSRGASYKGGSGYENKTSQWGKDVAMQSISSKKRDPVSSDNARDPYRVSITGVADREGWEALHRKDSDESITPLQKPDHVLSSLKNNGILMTHQISVV